MVDKRFSKHELFKLAFESQLEKVCYHIVCAKTGSCGKKIHSLFPTSGKTAEEGNQNLQRQRFSLRSICIWICQQKTCVWLWSGSGWVVMFTPIWRRFAVWTLYFWSVVPVNQDPLEIYKTLSIRWSVIAYLELRSSTNFKLFLR